MQKYFNVAGPCFPDQHYMIPASERSASEMRRLIAQHQYFVLHAARQTGKTTLLKAMTKWLNAEGNCYALYCSLEKAYGITDSKEGSPAIVQIIQETLATSSLPFAETFAQNADYSNYASVVGKELRAYCKKLDKPLAILFDEADCLSEMTLISFLRQLRDGYISRDIAPFPASIALIGLRSLRDYKAQVRENGKTLGSASPFNIIADSLNLRDFTKDEITELYAQHTAATGQVFNEGVVDLVFEQTQGQPWLVNAIARECVEKILHNDFTQPVTTAMVEQAVQTIIQNRPVHIDSLLDKLNETRVRNIIEPLILGGDEMMDDQYMDDLEYVQDLGLIRFNGSEWIPANPIYGEVIIRKLTAASQAKLKNAKYPYQMPRYLKDGKIDTDYLLRDFQQFWRENSDIWAERYDYKEAAPHLIMMAFLQRVINGGGQLMREVASGSCRVDLCMVYEGRKYPIELKILRGGKTEAEGLQQTARYMDLMGCAEGSLVIFDRDGDKSWDERIYVRTHSANGKKIRIYGC